MIFLTLEELKLYFMDDGSPINPTTLTTAFNKFAKKIGINFNFHMLRQTHATMMLEAGANIKVVQERLGHAKANTTLDIYSHVTKKLEDDAIDKFENFFN